MNIKEFIEYRKACPLCHTDLKTAFISKKRQVVEELNGQITFCFSMQAFRKEEISHKIKYVVDPITNSFFVEFYIRKSSYEDVLLNEVSIFTIKNYHSFIKNILNPIVHRYCDQCEMYDYSSESFIFDYKKQKLSGVFIQREEIIIDKELDDQGEEFQIFRIVNNMRMKRTWIYSARSNVRLDEQALYSIHAAEPVCVDLIKFPDNFKESRYFIDRISKLLIFA